MKLRSPDALRDDYAAIGRAIIGNGGHALRIIRFDVVGMGKIKIGIGPDISEDRQIRMEWSDLIPAHVRNLRAVRNAPHLTGEEAQPIDLALGMVLCQQLHAQADTQKWLALPR